MKLPPAVSVRRQRSRGFWPPVGITEFHDRPRLPRGFWRQKHTLNVLSTFVRDLEKARGDQDLQKAAMDRAVEALGGKQRVNAADVVWYARLLDKTGTTSRMSGRADDAGRSYSLGYDQEGHLVPERVVLGEGGRLVIPASYRRFLAWSEGEQLILQPEGRELRILTPQAALSRAQASVREHVSAGRSLADELIAERRQEASSE